MPHLIIIAGPNGAGKSTSAPALLKDALSTIASALNHDLSIYDDALWQQLSENFNEKS